MIGINLSINRPLTTVATPLLLDTYSGAAAAYSLRKLSNSYSGSAIRVRRSSDNTEQDIGFDGNGNLNESSLTSFVGSNSGYVTKWYDQSGNARDASQTTSANQPRIVNAGSIDKISGKSAFIFNGSSNYLIVNSSSGLTISPTTFMAVSSRSNSSTNLRTVFATGILSGTRGYGVYYSNTNNLYFQTRYTTTTANSIGNYSNTINTNSLFYGLTKTSGDTTYYNGSNEVTSSASETNNTTSTNITIGVRLSESSSLDFYLNGSISEIIIWQLDQSSNRSGIETNINSYYSIY